MKVGHAKLECNCCHHEGSTLLILEAGYTNDGARFWGLMSAVSLVRDKCVGGSSRPAQCGVVEGGTGLTWIWAVEGRDWLEPPQPILSPPTLRPDWRVGQSNI